jgi:hypothetical protein
VIYNARGVDGLFDAYSANSDGSDPRCLTCAVPSLPGVGAATQRGASDASPDGNYMLLDVERGSHIGTVGATEAERGQGAYKDVWLARTDGTEAWPLTDITAPGQQAIGTIWPRFDRTGHRLANGVRAGDRARNPRAFFNAAYTIGYTFNWFYADDKHIAYFNSGLNQSARPAQIRRSRPGPAIRGSGTPAPRKRPQPASPSSRRLRARTHKRPTRTT